MEKDDAAWRETLSPHDYHICREKGTEPAFSGLYYDCQKTGFYLCKCCHAPLFKSNTKYDSGSGWPSFWQPINDQAITTVRDTSHGMIRTEVMCAKCECHLGHVFEDGPQPTGLRYCINSASLSLNEHDEPSS